MDPTALAHDFRQLPAIQGADEAAVRGRGDIQGNILRGYASHLHAAYLLTRISDKHVEDARALLTQLIDEDRIATEKDWAGHPATRLNVALTRAGLARWDSTRPRSIASRTSVRACMRAPARTSATSGPTILSSGTRCCVRRSTCCSRCMGAATTSARGAPRS